MTADCRGNCEIRTRSAHRGLITGTSGRLHPATLMLSASGPANGSPLPGDGFWTGRGFIRTRRDCRETVERLSRDCRSSETRFRGDDERPSRDRREIPESLPVFWDSVGTRRDCRETPRETDDRLLRDC
ncbi:hypothetical protein Bbelb_098140 [Branchiostoma belcheri]|nr:hypothetical protein Bbelb_098140 [Branchiostoma belcheri]